MAKAFISRTVYAQGVNKAPQHCYRRIDEGESPSHARCCPSRHGQRDSPEKQ